MHLVTPPGSAEASSPLSRERTLVSYADDISLVGSSIAGVTRLYSAVSTFLSVLGLSVVAAECKAVILSPARPPPSNLAVANGRVPVVERVRMLGFGVDFLGHITPWRPRDPTLVRAVSHHLSRVSLATYPGALVRAVLTLVLLVWLWGVELWEL